ncbi:MAG: SpoIIE family protein phosphatase [Treponema sp.]|jgi:sigma-B regulation protein RsbU (phosphoserine phosphatase)|nr:SpoIIE family protein phosphatase [Treponema sp.]
MAPVHSLRTKILVIVMAFITIIGSAFVIYSISTAENFEQLRYENIQKTIEFETEKVNSLIAELERSAVFYAMVGKLCFDAQSEEFGNNIIMQYVSSFTAAVGGGFWFEPHAFKKDKLRSGFYAFHDKSSGTVRPDNSFLMDEYDYHSKRWYRDIMENVSRPYEVVWTKPYVDDSGSFSLMTTAGAGIYDDNGVLIAVSTVDWEIDDVVRELLAIVPTRNSIVLLCVPKQDFIISAANSNLFPGDPMNSIPWDINSGNFTYNGVDYLGFGRYMDNGWLLSVQIPEKEIYEILQKRNIRFTILITFSLISMLFIAYTLITKYINAPIKKLTYDVSNLALGNLDTMISITSNDEIGQFARVFNKMTSDLKKSIEEATREHSEKERIQAELNVAAEIQSSMLPCIFPPFPDRKEFDLYASMVPAKEVCGDFYDFYFLDRNNLAVIIADVSGKGVPASLFMVIAKTLIKNCIDTISPKSVCESVNKKLCEGNETSMFVTAFLGFYNIPTGKFVYVSAGHNPPLIKKKNQNYKFLKTTPCYVLAWNKSAKFTEEETYLEKGDILYMYTDGITEAMNGDLEIFGEQRLLYALNQAGDLTPRELLNAVKKEIDNFTEGAQQTDDVTMFALKVNTDQENADIDYSFDGELTLEVKKENLEKAQDFICLHLEKAGVTENFQNEICMACEEIFMNIAKYAYKPDTGNVKIYVCIKDKAVIRFEDYGIPYNPLDHTDPYFDDDIAKREVGGLGIYLVKQLMDTMEYARRESQNILTLTKNYPHKI